MRLIVVQRRRFRFVCTAAAARRRPSAGSAERLTPAVPVRSVEASGPGFLDCLPRTVIVIGAIADVCRIAVGGIAAVGRSAIVVSRSAIIAVGAARDRATDYGASQRARSPTPASTITKAPSETSVSPSAAAPAAPADLDRTVGNH